MKSNKFLSVTRMHPLLFTAGMFLVAASFTVMVCFTMVYASHRISVNNTLTKSTNSTESATVKSMYASVK